MSRVVLRGALDYLEHSFWRASVPTGVAVEPVLAAPSWLCPSLIYVHLLAGPGDSLVATSCPADLSISPTTSWNCPLCWSSSWIQQEVYLPLLGSYEAISVYHLHVLSRSRPHMPTSRLVLAGMVTPVESRIYATSRVRLSLLIAAIG